MWRLQTRSWQRRRVCPDRVGRRASPTPETPTSHLKHPVHAACPQGRETGSSASEKTTWKQQKLPAHGCKKRKQNTGRLTNECGTYRVTTGCWFQVKRLSDETQSLPLLEALHLLSIMKGSSKGPSMQKNHQRLQFSVKHFSFYQNILCWKDRFSQTQCCCNIHHFAAKTSAVLECPGAAHAVKYHKKKASDNKKKTHCWYDLSISSTQEPPQFLCQKCTWGYVFKLFSTITRTTICLKTRMWGLCLQQKLPLVQSLTTWQCLETPHQPHNLMTISCLP